MAYVWKDLVSGRDLKLDEVEQMLWDAGFNAFLTKARHPCVSGINQQQKLQETESPAISLKDKISAHTAAIKARFLLGGHRRETPIT